MAILLVDFGDAFDFDPEVFWSDADIGLRAGPKYQKNIRSTIAKIYQRAQDHASNVSIFHCANVVCTPPPTPELLQRACSLPFAGFSKRELRGPQTASLPGLAKLHPRWKLPVTLRVKTYYCARVVALLSEWKLRGAPGHFWSALRSAGGRAPEEERTAAFDKLAKHHCLEGSAEWMSTVFRRLCLQLFHERCRGRSGRLLLRNPSPPVQIAQLRIQAQCLPKPPRFARPHISQSIPFKRSVPLGRGARLVCHHPDRASADTATSCTKGSREYGRNC